MTSTPQPFDLAMQSHVQTLTNALREHRQARRVPLHVELPPACFGRRFTTEGFEHRFGDDAQPIATQLMERFSRNDWGDLCAQDVQCNHDTIDRGEGRLMGQYDVDGQLVWVIAVVRTDPLLQRDALECHTCVLLPEDY